MHVASGDLAVERDALVLGHKLFNSETGDVCTTVEQRVHHVVTKRRAARAFAPPQLRSPQRPPVEWGRPPRRRQPRPPRRHLTPVSSAWRRRRRELVSLWQ